MQVRTIIVFVMTVQALTNTRSFLNPFCADSALNM